MRVWELGEGRPLLAIHGLGGSGRYWRRFAERAGERMRVVAPDLAGFGASDKPRDASYDVAFHLENLDAALETAQGPVAVLGHSLGGVLAAFWAAEHPERTSALALLATPFPLGDGENPWMREGTPPKGARTYLRALRVLVSTLSLPVGVARGYPPAVARDYGRQRFLGRARTTWWALHDPGLAARVGRVATALARVPTLLAYSRDDHTVEIAAQARWAGVLPAAERIVVPGGGHQFLLRGGEEPLLDWLDATLRA
jgi:pimeloyl-ACP methyl ester carboxylesterase